MSYNVLASSWRGKVKRQATSKRAGRSIFDMGCAAGSLLSCFACTLRQDDGWQLFEQCPDFDFFVPFLHSASWIGGGYADFREAAQRDTNQARPRKSSKLELARSEKA